MNKYTFIEHLLCTLRNAQGSLPLNCQAPLSGKGDVQHYKKRNQQLTEANFPKVILQKRG